MNESVQRVLDALKRNNIEGIYFETAKDARKYLKENLEKGAVISSGGSMSLVESGILELLKGGDYDYRDRDKKGITPEERLEVFKAIVGADYYFCSSNAITENGELINVDGTANRVSAISFGPKKVIFVVGTNKIVKDVNEGFLRVKKIAAPKNCVRLKLNTPCVKLGHCISLQKNEHPEICDGCDHPSRICREYLVTARQNAAKRMTVLLIGEKLGY